MLKEPNSYELARRRDGLTQAKVEEIAGLKQAYLSSIENGKHEPSMEKARKLADAYRCSIDELVGHEVKRDG